MGLIKKRGKTRSLISVLKKTTPKNTWADPNLVFFSETAWSLGEVFFWQTTLGNGLVQIIFLRWGQVPLWLTGRRFFFPFLKIHKIVNQAPIFVISDYSIWVSSCATGTRQKKTTTKKLSQQQKKKLWRCGEETSSKQRFSLCKGIIWGISRGGEGG